MRFVLQKLRRRYIWERIWRERLTEPLALNVASLGVALFGGLRSRIEYDLVIRQPYAWGLLTAADAARALGITRLTALEFGVAAGAGLMNMAQLARRIGAETGVTFEIVGFDGGCGMPPPRDWRDHPEFYRKGDYPTPSRQSLEAALPANARIVWGPVEETVGAALAQLSAPVGFISFDMDYYWSTMAAFGILDGPPEMYLPSVPIYLDDVIYLTHNPFAGELLAVKDFNDAHPMRKIARVPLERSRLFKRTVWIHQMYFAHVFDHPHRTSALESSGNAVLSNPYL